MRFLFFCLIALFLTGCSSAGIFSDDMQPDGSYKILAGGNAFASVESTKKQVYARADALCPKGYELKSEMADTSIKPRYQIIVKCK